MNKSVYRHLLATYGRALGFWFGFFTEGVRAFIGRVVTVILLANIVAAVSIGDFDRAKESIFLWAALTIGATVLASAGELVSLRAENRMYETLSASYYQHLTNKDMAFYRDSHTGYVTAMYKQYLDSGLLLVRLIRNDLLRTAISLLFPVVVLLFASWTVGLTMVLLIISQAIYVVWASAKANKYRLASHEIFREISGEVADDVTNIIAYKSSGKEKEALHRIEKLAKRETYTFWQRRAIVVFLDFPRNVVTVLLVAGAFWLALSSDGTVDETVGLLVLTITYMFQVLRNVSELPQLMIRHDDLVTKMGPTLDVLSGTYQAIEDKPNPQPFNPTTGSVEFKNLTFKYGDDDTSKYIFKNFNLKIAGGEKVGVVGLSGAGKSTLASLIMRFDEVTAGEIRIDEANIRDVSQSNLRSKIAYVPQEPILFHRSIRDNIAYHNETTSDAEIEKAAKAAHAHEFIKDLPQGYRTIVGERGVKLSGGQKQRIVIARAVLKKAPIILFDEATSALDSESEHIIQKALPQITGDHTAIIIAHRLSTVASLDRIVVMHHGKIVEEGTHKQLLVLKGRYYALWQRQTADELS